MSKTGNWFLQMNKNAEIMQEAQKKQLVFNLYRQFNWRYEIQIVSKQITERL
jgi:hypothetical protein